MYASVEFPAASRNTKFTIADGFVMLGIGQFTRSHQVPLLKPLTPSLVKVLTTAPATTTSMETTSPEDHTLKLKFVPPLVEAPAPLFSPPVPGKDQ